MKSHGMVVCAARSEAAAYVEYDLDNEDEDWLLQLNNERKILSPERFERMLYQMETLDYKARERAGVTLPMLGSPMPVMLTRDATIEVLFPYTFLVLVHAKFCSFLM
jgi:enhancer of polycomb-like protein